MRAWYYFALLCLFVLLYLSLGHTRLFADNDENYPLLVFLLYLLYGPATIVIIIKTNNPTPPSPGAPVHRRFLLEVDKTKLDNGLQLPCVPQRILNDQLAHLLLGTATRKTSVLRIVDNFGLLGEVNHAILKDPAAGAGEINDGALGLEEEEGLGRRNGEVRVGALAGGGDFGANLGGEDLRRVEVSNCSGVYWWFG